MTENIAVNTPRAWRAAARPQTLTAAIAPVIVALAAAIAARQGALDIIPAILCAAFAMVMQIDANFINDYYDYRRGHDRPTERLGPPRACTMGWITPRAMRRAIALTTALAVIIGLPLVIYGGTGMLLVGAACVVGSFLYTTWGASNGLGDVLVIIFFGLVPVICTYYLQTQQVTGGIIALAIATGAVIDNLLIVNNYRDIDNDRKDGKRTLAVIIGRQQTLALYLLLGSASTLVVLVYAHCQWWAAPVLLYLFAHCHTYRNMRRLTGKALNRCLAETARNNLLFALTLAAALLLSLL